MFLEVCKPALVELYCAKQLPNPNQANGESVLDPGYVPNRLDDLGFASGIDEMSNHLTIFTDEDFSATDCGRCRILEKVDSIFISMCPAFLRFLERPEDDTLSTEQRNAVHFILALTPFHEFGHAIWVWRLRSKPGFWLVADEPYLGATDSSREAGHALEAYAPGDFIGLKNWPSVLDGSPSDGSLGKSLGLEKYYNWEP